MSFERLTSLVHRGQLELNWVVGPPRSNGNALHLLLTQSDEITSQIDEPFHVIGMPERKYILFAQIKESETKQLLEDAFERGCSHIVKKYEALSPQASKVSLMVHDISQTLSEEDFDKIKGLSRSIVFTTRNPIEQALSMLTRYTNDRWSSFGVAFLSTENVLEFMNDETCLSDYISQNSEKFNSCLLEKNEEELQGIRKETLQLIEDEFNASWIQIQKFINATSDTATPFRAIFDANQMFEEPEKHISELAQTLQIGYKDAMINNWTKCVGPNFDCVITRFLGDQADQNAWNGPARTSTCIKKQQDHSSQSLHSSQFPKCLRNAIKNCSKIYQTIRGNP
jgi:hypothetical protein